jgi:hypothetical protein
VCFKNYFLLKAIILGLPIHKQFVKFNSLSFELLKPSLKNLIPVSVILKQSAKLSIVKDRQPAKDFNAPSLIRSQSVIETCLYLKKQI